MKKQPQSKYEANTFCTNCGFIDWKSVPYGIPVTDELNKCNTCGCRGYLVLCQTQEELEDYKEKIKSVTH